MSSTKETNAKILDDHFGPDRLSYSDLETKYGRSRSSLERLIRTAKAEGRTYSEDLNPKVDKRSIQARRPISARHAHIALKVIRFRAENDLSCTQFGNMIGVSRAKVGPIEAGSYDLTLRQIVKISEVLNIPVEKLLEKPVQLQSIPTKYA